MDNTLTQSSSPLFRAPLEIRQKIYNHVLDLELATYPSQLRSDYIARKSEHSELRFLHPPDISRAITNVTIGLFTACKDTHAEIRQVISLRQVLGNSTCRIELLVTSHDDFVKIRQVKIAPLERSQRHNVQICVRYPEGLTITTWHCQHPAYLLTDVLHQLVRYGPLLRQTRLEQHQSYRANVVEVDLPDCGDRCLHGKHLYRSLQGLASHAPFSERIGLLRVRPGSSCSAQEVVMKMGKDGSEIREWKERPDRFGRPMRIYYEHDGPGNEG